MLQLSSEEVEVAVYEWDYYQQIIYNYISSLDIDLENGSDDAKIIKNLIASVQISRQMSLSVILETIQGRVSKFVKYCGVGFSDFSLAQRIQIALSNRKFANAAVCMAGITQVV